MSHQFEDRLALRDLIYDAYRLSLSLQQGESVEHVLDALQVAYQQGLDMTPDYAPPSEENPPF